MFFDDKVLLRNATAIRLYNQITDSRSFSSYSRFDFFRRIICDYVGSKVESGEYDEQSAKTLIESICYYNAKQMVGI